MTDTEILQYASEFRFAVIGDRNSARMCAAISAPLCAALVVLGVPSLVMESNLCDCNHVFIQLQDGRVLDPTADQFNWCSSSHLPGVYLGRGTKIHANAQEHRQAECWKPLLQEFKRFAPQYSAQEVGSMVRLTLATLPAGMCELPA